MINLFYYTYSSKSFNKYCEFIYWYSWIYELIFIPWNICTPFHDLQFKKPDPKYDRMQFRLLRQVFFPPTQQVYRNHQAAGGCKWDALGFPQRSSKSWDCISNNIIKNVGSNERWGCDSESASNHKLVFTLSWHWPCSIFA